MSYEKSILVAEGVTKSFGSHKALNRVSLSIPENSIYGVLGPNGAGKTTFLRIVNQITYPDSGTVYFNGEPLKQEHVAMIGYLPEERGLYKGMKVGEQVLYLAQLRGLEKQEARARLKYWFERLDIGDWWNRKIQELSKGMAQKIQFIVTVLHEPRLLIFDEPFSGFDPINANIIKEEILHLKERGASIIFSTHRMESVEELCEYIALLHEGEVILDGKLFDIKRKYKRNLYSVQLETAKGEAALAGLREHFQILSPRFDPLIGHLDFTVQLANGEAQQFLAKLGTTGSIIRFVETVPSANEIFIQTVQEKMGNE
ncbi:MAG: ATP-binding cassette domain-containing protein [Eudoraea sp.]|nr:ATP-binding cassette domain-containing protein [Eudoraea sp.]MBT8322225.1 ATP-binding cassette domain-containing protein [Eudoraea sp.]NNJ39893.1 ABC transporter ATP-binding protein [Eudoraea sp.]